MGFEELRGKVEKIARAAVLGGSLAMTPPTSTAVDDDGSRISRAEAILANDAAMELATKEARGAVDKLIKAHEQRDAALRSIVIQAKRGADASGKNPASNEALEELLHKEAE